MSYNFKDVLFAGKENRETKPKKVAKIIILWLVLMLETGQRMAHIAKYGTNQKGNRTLLDKNNYSYNLEKKVLRDVFYMNENIKQMKSRKQPAPGNYIIIALNRRRHDGDVIWP